MNPDEEFEEERIRARREQGADADLVRLSREWMVRSARHGYTYNFRWLGRPIIQFPQDIIALQEVIWQVKPQAIVETGVARGGSAVFFASMLELLGDPAGRVVAVDIDIREHNRKAVESHFLAKRIELVQGSSTQKETVAEVAAAVGHRSPVMVVLDSDHTEAHVAAELQAYSHLVTPGSYLVVMDTSVEFAPKDLFPNRSWGPGNSPLTAVRAFLENDRSFAVDKAFDDKLLISVAPQGFLRKRLP